MHALHELNLIWEMAYGNTPFENLNTQTQILKCVRNLFGQITLSENTTNPFLLSWISTLIRMLKQISTRRLWNKIYTSRKTKSAVIETLLLRFDFKLYWTDFRSVHIDPRKSSKSNGFKQTRFVSALQQKIKSNLLISKHETGCYWTHHLLFEFTLQKYLLVLPNIDISSRHK
jgi:hypothetical protein